VTDRLEAAARAHKRAQTKAGEARTALAEAIIDAVRQVDIARITGYTRENIRLMVKAAREAGKLPPE
jgi:hypothetical protein